MAQLLKRIIRAEIPNVFISDLQVFLRNVGDSIDLIGADVTGNPYRTLEEVCRSVDLDRLLKRLPPPITLWDENGNQLTGSSMERSTNLATLVDSSVGSDSFQVSTFAVTENGGTYDGEFIFEKGYTVPNLSFAWTANESLSGKPSFSPNITLDGNPDASVGSGSLTGANIADSGTYSYTMTLTSVNGDTDDETSTLSWYYRAHWGFLSAATTNITTEVQIEALSQNALQNDTYITYSDTGTSSQEYFWICIPATWTEIETLIDTNGGLNLPFLEQSQVSVTGAHGTVANYRVYRSYNSTAVTSLTLGVN